MNDIDPFQHPGCIVFNFNLDASDAPRYLSLVTGRRITVQEAEEQGQTDVFPYEDPERPELDRRVVIGDNLIALRSKPYYHFHIATRDGSELPEDLRDIGVFITLRNLTQYLDTHFEKKSK